MLRALQVGIHISDLEGLTVSEVMDILIEHANDGCEYDRIATQDDFDAFIN